MTIGTIRICAIGIMVLAAYCRTAGAETTLWEIGNRDNSAAEFAHGPGNFQDYSLDGYFIAGKTDTAQDWPYAHPGPADAWSGTRSHTFLMVFGVGNIPSSGECTLTIDCVDTHGIVPPLLEIDVNGTVFTRKLPKGGSDASISGDPSGAEEYVITVPIPVKTILPGENRITIRSVSGSWFVYDWVGFSAPDGMTSAPAAFSAVHSTATPQILLRRNGTVFQPVTVYVVSTENNRPAMIALGSEPPLKQRLSAGMNEIHLEIKPVAETMDMPLTITLEGTSLKRDITVPAVRQWAIHLLHHSHVDIGYTHVQSEVEQKQWGYLEQVIDLARKSENYPVDSRFIWNAEVLWAVESYLENATPEKRAAFVEAVKKGWIQLDALYANMLTGLSRDEELIRLFDRTNRIELITGVPIESAMITDVPGYTWGLVTTMAAHGVKYFSIGPNRGHRIGATLEQWADRPFYWVSPSGGDKVLCWITGEGYSLFHAGLNRYSLSEDTKRQRIEEHLKRLEESSYPYDMTCLRYSLGSDNGPPDMELADMVKSWNERYASPRLIISSSKRFFWEFETRYGDSIPAVAGDFTPYWEDGAASSARETALTRRASERLVQAEILWSLNDPANYPAERFSEAWRNVLLYNEHTWGSWNSISEPESDFTKQQWATKQGFALTADTMSRKLLADALGMSGIADNVTRSYTVYNTESWPRTDIVTIPADVKTAGDAVRCDGKSVPSQRLSTGELVFVTENVPALGSAVFTFHDETPTPPAKSAHADTGTISNELITVGIDARTGTVVSLRRDGIPGDFVAPEGDSGLSGYRYVDGRNPSNTKRGGSARITVLDDGPLVARVRVESPAPGTRSYTRDYTLAAGFNRLDITAVIDKELVYSQEGVHLAFPFDIPDPEVRIDLPWAVARVETDQIPGANRNYYTAQRFVDISNNRTGVTLAMVDAPMVEIGAITTDATVTGWLPHIEPSPTVYSYVMNNYWETNYCAGQKGPVTFEYAVRLHRRYIEDEAYRFGLERSRPLVAVPSKPDAKPVKASIFVEGAALTSIRPPAGTKMLECRLYNPGDGPIDATVTVDGTFGNNLRFADVGQGGLSGNAASFTMLPHEVVTLVLDRR